MAKKTLAEREKELQALLATPRGKAELQALAERYAATGERSCVGSVITYILVHERTHDMLAG